jgi:putative NADH-flavin reductase
MKVIITGTTGMVGEGVLIECLSHPQITEVLSVSRKSADITHPKLKEYIVADFLSLQENDKKLVGYDACFFCAGVSSVGVKEPEYTRITYDTAMSFAKAISLNAEISFIYVSGAGTDSSEKGRSMWARVKGKTENDLTQLPFKQMFAFRPGFIKAIRGQKKLPKWYKYGSWLFPVLKIIPGTANSMQQVAQAMIYAAQYGYEQNIVEVRDIDVLWKKALKKAGHYSIHK